MASLHLDNVYSLHIFSLRNELRFFFIDISKHFEVHDELISHCI